MVEHDKQSHQKSKYLKLGFCPFLKWLGIEEGLTPDVWATITHIPPLLENIKCPFATYKLLDFYHAAAHLQDFVDAAFTTDGERQSWFKNAQKTLKKGQALNLIRNMDQFISSTTGERCKILVRERNYILKAYRRRLLNYQLVATHHLPLGSGAIESLIRQVVNLRMKGNSKFWLQDNAQIMLHLRCQLIPGSWDNFCNSIFNSFLNPSSAYTFYRFYLNLCFSDRKDVRQSIVACFSQTSENSLAPTALLSYYLRLWQTRIYCCFG